MYRLLVHPHSIFAPKIECITNNIKVMNKLIDKTLSSLFKLAERLTGTQAQPTTTNSQPQKPQTPAKIRFTKADKWVQGELFD